MKNHFQSKVIWFTGLSGSGKTTLAELLSQKLIKFGYKVNQIDGDTFRKKTKNKNKFTKQNIIQNNNLIIKHLENNKINYDFLIVSVISPLSLTRSKAKKKFKEKYFEIYTKCSIKTLIERDTKGLYHKAKIGKIKNLIGFNSNIVYEKSNYKKIIVNTETNNKKNCIQKILNYIV